jgi:glycosyltransferase involved in cell wall biosynthesis
MRVAAILAVRNERPYLANCLGHLIRNGIDFSIIDNDSTDGTRALLETGPFRDHLIEYVHHPYPGYFDWTGLMQAREAAAARTGADWVVFVSADEIMHSFKEGETLADAIGRVDKTGADAIDFNEFVFLPVEQDYVPDTAAHQPGRHYYFFEPHKPRLMRARKRGLSVSHIGQGGHTFSGGDFTLAQESFVLRHYIFRDQDHADRKYVERVFAARELELGWHRNRLAGAAMNFKFPSTALLQQTGDPDRHALDRSNPRMLHYWEWTQDTNKSGHTPINVTTHN